MMLWYCLFYVLYNADTRAADYAFRPHSTGTAVKQCSRCSQFYGYPIFFVIGRVAQDSPTRLLPHSTARGRQRGAKKVTLPRQ